ncbi:Ail/Lom family outer membrane beta-barrel protein, partial [Escherichia coli]
MRKLYAAILSAAICLAVSGAPVIGPGHTGNRSGRGGFRT